MKLFNLSLLAPVVLSAAAATAVSGQVLFTDDFEAWTAGQPVTDSGVDPLRWKSDGDPFDIIELDTDNVFGRGTDNQFMRVGNVPVGGALPGGSLDIEQRTYDKGDGVPTGVLRVSFDLYEPSSGSGRGFVDDLSDPGYLRIRGADTGAGLHIIIIDDGEIQVSAGEGAVNTLYAFGEDRVVRMDFVFNQSGDDVSYRGTVLNSGKFAVYANNFLVASNIESGTNDPTDEVARILLRTQYPEGGTVAQEMWVDNWETAAVPDPASEVHLVNISPRFGWVNNLNAPWYYSQKHGWLYFTVGDSIFYYQDVLGEESGGWMFMTDETYPFAYQYSLETWVNSSEFE